MAQRIEHFDVVADKNQPLPASTTDAVTFPPGVIVGIDVYIPGGHKGQTGLRIFYGNGQVVPRSEGAWLRGNKKTYSFPFDDPIPGGTGWFTEVYNAGKYDHTFRLSLQVDDLLGTLARNPPVILVPFGGEPGFEEGTGGETGGVVVPGDGGGGGSIDGPVPT